tara:strand:- start:3172 stop:3741 length:570 start_codon:yes stop_codon:yes gene_type:complete
MPNPSKQYFYDNVYKDLSKIKFSKVIDFACGEMDFLKKFNPTNYTGVDIDLERLKYGKKKYNKINYIHSEIKDIKDDQQYDLSICFQTIGINNFFKLEDEQETLNKIASSVLINGHLAINFLRISKKKEEKIIQFLIEKKFKIIKIKYYGLFDFQTSYIVFRFLLMLLKITFSFFSLNKKYFYIIMKKV